MSERPTEKYTAFGSIVCERCHTYPQMTDSNWCAQCSGKHSVDRLQARIADLLAVLERREERISMLEERLAAAREYMMWPHTLAVVALTQESKR
jgi:predicted RNase H-like nuclease (RuvC/YqgF family)